MAAATTSSLPARSNLVVGGRGGGGSGGGAGGGSTIGRTSGQMQTHQSQLREMGVGGETQTQTQTQTRRLQPVLHLRGDEGGSTSANGSGRRIQWAADVVDNEGLGRKSSKVCCIYHAPRPIDESSDESSDDSDSSSDDDDSEPDNSTARAAGGSGGGGSGKGTRKSGTAKGRHDGCDHSHGKGTGKAKNAYEKMPKPRVGRGGAGNAES